MSTVQHIWDDARKQKLRRTDPFGIAHIIDPGVNYFILKLESIGAKTHFSCEGHPRGFYILMEATYDLAMAVARCGYFTVAINGNVRVALILHRAEEYEQLDEAIIACVQSTAMADYNWWSIRLTDFSNLIRTERHKRKILREAATSWDTHLENFARQTVLSGPGGIPIDPPGAPHAQDQKDHL